MEGPLRHTVGKWSDLCRDVDLSYELFQSLGIATLPIPGSRSTGGFIMNLLRQDTTRVQRAGLAPRTAGAGIHRVVRHGAALCEAASCGSATGDGNGAL